MRAEGLVLCNPFGSEALSAHRSLRHFADAAAAVGIPALRFDYDGTGDSAGTDHDPGRLMAWLRSVHDAIDELRRTTGVARVYLFGIRLGAALAALAAADRDDVAGFVAVVPVVSGRQWLREIDALQIAMRVGDPPPGVKVESGVHESAGFVITPETRSAISQVDLLALSKPPATDVLLITRADLAPNPRWPDRLRALGSTVDQRLLAGYTEMMLDPHEAVVPAAMVDAVAGWLDAHASQREAAPQAARSAPALSKPVLVGPGVVESYAYLDESRGLFGIISSPAGGERPEQAVLLLNSGANHRIGPGRLYVHLARRWAARGYVVLRVDHRGIGDSAPRTGEAENVVYPPSATRDVDDAVKFLRDAFGATSFSAIGLCSGAYHALKAAVAGVALSRILAINPLVFFWKEGMSLSVPPHMVFQSAAQYRRSLFKLDKWRKLFTGKVDVVEFAQVVARRSVSTVGGWSRDVARSVGHPVADDLGVELEALSRRDVSIAFVFSAGDPGEDLLRVQGGASLRKLVRARRVRIHRIEGPNHTFTPTWSHPLVTATLEGELGIR